MSWMKKPKAPAPPDPNATARSAIGTNLFAAKANNRMQMMDQTGPFGSVRHRQTGTQRMTDPNTGFVADVPTYKSITSFNPQEQAAYDANVNARTGAGVGANRAISSWMDLNPVDGAMIEDRADRIMGNRGIRDANVFHRIEPMLARRREEQEAYARARGVDTGMESWRNLQEDLGQAETDAFTETAIRERAQLHNEAMDARRLSFSELMGERRAPLEAAAALSGMSGAIAPTGQVVGPGGFAAPDVAGLTGQAYDQRRRKYEADLASWNQLWGEVGNLAGDGIAFLGRR